MILTFIIFNFAALNFTALLVAYFIILAPFDGDLF